MMDAVKFVVEASEAESLTNKLGLPSVHHLLPALVQPAQSLARPPISNYPVAAVGLGSDGRLFLGVNLEFPGVPLHHSVHAEQFLITNLAVHRCPRLLAFAVSAAPCGHCRQFLQETRNSSDIKIHITSTQNNPDMFEPLRDILPNPFGPFDLLDDETPLLLERHNNGLSLSEDLCNGFSVNSGNLSNGSNKNEISVNSGNLSNVYEISGNSGNLSNGYEISVNSGNLSNGSDKNGSTLLRIAASEAANDSHAPYSGCPSGVALMDCEGKIYRGSYVESAAYNPSLGPVQAALVAFVARGGGGYEQIVAAALVEKEGAKVRQEDTARLFLKLVSPKCDLKVFHCCFAENGCKKIDD
ncbi:cytidine deaminase 1-like [Lycium barbarum]|uniref:cytidine deaminase 1-like n=1 Tax=Lycium barbarum TaxID=112863 RepID=UPI00293E443C|nr:cytidine deaminase 1-like [Lycium barbarum]